MEHRYMINDNQIRTVEAFDVSAGQYNNTIAKLSNYNHTFDYLLNLLDDDQTILDLACGPANISSYLLNKKRLNMIGIDLSEAMLSIAKKAIPSGRFIKSSIVDFSIMEKVDLVVNGFGLPYLNSPQVIRCLEKCHDVIKPGGLIYLSFMHGEKCGFETPSFNRETEIFIYYHHRDSIINTLVETGFIMINMWELDYVEQDGSITKDIILIAKKRSIG